MGISEEEINELQALDLKKMSPEALMALEKKYSIDLKEYEWRTCTNLQCRYCQSENVEQWDNENKPCPRCESPMGEDPNGLTIRH